MSNEKTVGPAFPYVIDPAPRADGLGRDIKIVEGQTLLDHFAGLAMQGIVQYDATGFQAGHVPARIASDSYAIAAAMIHERNRIMNEKP